MTSGHRCRVAGSPVHATVVVPGSKSIANRALVCAALADGTSTLRRVPGGDDTAAMVAGLAALGVVARSADGAVSVTGPMAGCGAPVRVDARLAGTTSRFLTALGTLAGRPVTVDGEPALRRRPMVPLHDALAALGAQVTPGGRRGHLPVTVDGTAGLRGGAVAVAGDVSSQFLTALMLIGPRLPGGLTIEPSTALVSVPYLTITARVMAAFGIDGVTVGEGRIVVPPATYRPALDWTIEPDATSASYPWAAGALTGGRVTVSGLGPESIQGDAHFPEVLARMGCAVETSGGASPATAVGGADGLTGIDVDLGSMSDLVPTMAALALFAANPSRIRGVGFIRAKESDRLGDLAGELRKLGADIDVLDDGLDIRPAVLHGAALDTHHDHRLAMAFGLVGLRVPGVVVDDPAVVSKSWPDYWAMLDELVEGSR